MASGPLTGEKSRGNRLFHGSKNTNRGFSGSHRDDCDNGGAGDDDDSPKRRRFETDDDSCSYNRAPVYRQGAGSLKLENLVRVGLNCGSKVGVKELRKRLVDELDRIRSLKKRIESLDFGNGITGSSGAGGYSTDAKQKSGRTMPPGKHDSSTLRGFGVAMAENNHGVGDIVEKEKRMMKDDVPTGKEKLPMQEVKKKSKSTGFGMGKNPSKLFKRDGKLFKSCSNLLAKLMKHKHGWVFNKPVDVKALQLHDYYTIVKHPMDLGTVKNRLNKNWYKSAEEFAEDVRLTFRNAMLYNPQGQDVHVMADILLKVFEDNWAALEAEYKLNKRFEMANDASLPAPTPRKVPATATIPTVSPARAPASSPQNRVPLPPAPEMRTLDRAESMTKPTDSKSKTASFGHPGRMPVPKKPKARDLDKRDMTLEEKQRLSINLQNLPSEKLGAIVEIIKKRNPPLSQQDDEIEVDIDAVDPETLWELDRFITNYKKGLSKNKRKAETAFHTSVESGHIIQDANLARVTGVSPEQTETVEENLNVTSSSPGQLEQAPFPPLQVKEPSSLVQVEKQGDNASGSSSSGNSSGDSGSSSSDSGSDSSSADGSVGAEPFSSECILAAEPHPL